MCRWISASINEQTVWLTSEDLEVVRGTITSQSSAEVKEPLYVFQPATQLQQATFYTVTLSSDIRAASPDEDVHIDPYYYAIKTTGVEREKLIQAIRELADTAAWKIDRDVETVARTYSDIYDIEKDLERADFFGAVFSQMTFVVNIFKGIPELVASFWEKPIVPQEILAQLSSLGLAFHGTVSSGTDSIRNEAGGRWIEAGLSEADLEIYKGAIKKGTNSNLMRSELELLLLGSDRPSPLRIPIVSGPDTDNEVTIYVEGAGRIKRDIRQEAENIITFLPDPLPPDFPSDVIYRELLDLKRGLRQSTAERVHIKYNTHLLGNNGERALDTTSVELGNIVLQRQYAQEYLKQTETQNSTEIRYVIYEAASTAVSVALIHPGLSALQPLEWAFAPGDAWVASREFADSFMVDPRDLLLQIPVTMLNQLPVELSDTYRATSELFESIPVDIHRRSGKIPTIFSPLFAFLKPVPAYAAGSNPSVQLTFTALELEDIILSAGRETGTGYGHYTVFNQGDTPLQVQAQVSLLPLNIEEGSRPVIGRGWSEEWVTVEPGEEGNLEVAFNVWGPGLTGQTEIQALVTLDVVPIEGGRPQTIGPYVQFARVGAKKHLENLPPQQTKLLAGELGFGEIHTTTLIVSPDAPSINLILNYAPAVSLSMTLENEAGNYIAYNGMSESAQVEGLDASHQFGAGYQTITLNEPPVGPLVLSVGGVVSARGRGMQYDVTLVETAEHPAILSAFPASIRLTSQEAPIPLQISAQELGGQQDITDLSIEFRSGSSEAGKPIETLWVNITPNVKQISAGQSAIINGEINLPTDSSAGDYVGTLLLQGKDAKSQETVTFDVPLVISWEPPPTPTPESTVVVVESATAVAAQESQPQSTAQATELPLDSLEIEEVSNQNQPSLLWLLIIAVTVVVIIVIAFVIRRRRSLQ